MAGGFPVLTDADIAASGDMGAAIDAVERALAARKAGGLVAPPRHHVGFGGGELVFTIGGVAGGAVGFRAYETFPGAGRDRAQVVAVWDGTTGALRGLVVGNALGPLRTGAIGGVAIRHMARAGAGDIAVIGAGEQARAQLWAAATVRSPRRVRVFSRTEAGRAAFARDMAARIGRAVTPVASARAAVEGADIVLCATTSETPVVEAAWLAPGAHVNTVGPKLRGASEIDADLALGAAVVATDSPAQVRAYGAPFFLEGTAAMDRLADLADIVGGTVPARADPRALTLFCSAGLAGTEVVVADALLAKATGRG